MTVGQLKSILNRFCDDSYEINFDIYDRDGMSDCADYVGYNIDPLYNTFTLKAKLLFEEFHR